MEIYTTSFTYPRRSRLSHSPATTFDFPPTSELRRAESYPHLPQSHGNGFSDSQGTASPSDYDALQKLAVMAMGLHGVHVSFASVDHGKAWSFQISGAYPQVMLSTLR